MNPGSSFFSWTLNLILYIERLMWCFFSVPGNVWTDFLARSWHTNLCTLHWLETFCTFISRRRYSELFWKIGQGFLELKVGTCNYHKFREIMENQPCSLILLKFLDSSQQLYQKWTLSLFFFKRLHQDFQNACKTK